MSSQKNILVPKGDGSSKVDDVKTYESLKELSSLVVVGANGCGKSRFGFAIEIANQVEHKVQRIAAQRALQVPETINPIAAEKAEDAYYYGNSAAKNPRPQQRFHFRWHTKPVTGLLNDVEQVLQLVLARGRERDREFTRSHQSNTPLPSVPESPTDKIERIWAKIFPHRQIRCEEGSFVTWYERENYNASEMSDGERVALYLMANVFVAFQDSILIIDEPEIHLHRSIRDSLFDELESERSDCLFVYLTHDVEFAASRSAATQLWLKEFNGISWKWERIEVIESLPPALTNQLLGNRRPVLFVEGEKGSLDALIYTACYPERYVVPVGSCGKVIQYTKAINESLQLHHLDAHGIIDRDFRTADEIKFLSTQRIHALPVAEAESLLLLPEVLRAVAIKLEHNPDEKVKETKALVLGSLADQLHSQAVQHVREHIRRDIIGALNEPIDSVEDLGKVISYVGTLADIEEVVKKSEEDLRNLIENDAYTEVLSRFNHKGLLPRVSSSVLGLKKTGQEDGMTALLRRSIQAGSADPIIERMRCALPKLPSTEASA